jgi:Na+/H+-dicarboxylate symporter
MSCIVSIQIKYYGSEDYPPGEQDHYCSPLLATLVVDIAGRSNIKQVGQMGFKVLICFGIVTTIALFIGLTPINFSQAGAGVKHQSPTNAH